MKKTLILFALVLVVSLSFSVIAEDISIDRANRLAFGYVLYLSDVSTTPAQIAPGADGTINLRLENIADTQLKDIRVELTLPTALAAYQDTVEFLESIELVIRSDFEKLTLAKLLPDDGLINQDFEHEMVNAPAAKKHLKAPLQEGKASRILARCGVFMEHEEQDTYCGFKPGFLIG